MSYRDFKSNANYYTLRIHNATTLRLINELAEKRGNRNAVLNDILDRGAPMVYAEIFGGKDSKTKNSPTEAIPSLSRELREIRKDLDDLYVLLSIYEPMIAGLYNEKIEALSGETVNPEELRGGALSELPEELGAIKLEIAGRHSRRRK